MVDDAGCAREPVEFGRGLHSAGAEPRVDQAVGEEVPMHLIGRNLLCSQHQPHGIGVVIGSSDR